MAVNLNPTTIEDLRDTCIQYKGNLSVINTSQMTSFRNLFNDNRFRSWTNNDFNGISSWNTSNVTDMSYTFSPSYGTSNFNQPLTNWNTRNVTNMSYMFSGCSSFNQSVNHFNVSKVTNMSYMFYGCKAFNQPLNSWNTLNLNSMIGMFRNCTKFNQSISNFNVSKVTNMSYLFQNCSSFNQDISNWSVSLVTNMSYMFSGCSSFNQSLNTWNVSNVTNMSDMFAYCSLFNQPLTSWNTRNVTNMSSMFYGCTNFTQSLTNFNVSNVTDMSYMFGGCINYNLPLTGWNTSNVTNMSYMFSGCTKFNQSLTNLNVSSVTNMSSMFDGCTIYNLPLTGWNTSNVTNMSYMFRNCSSFNQSLSNINVSKVINMSYMFYGCSKFNQDISSWNVSKVTNMSYMFYGCTIYNRSMINWVTSSVTNMSYMFYNCVNFNNYLTNWNTSLVTNMSYMFYGCTNFNRSLSSWNVSNVTDMSNMFYGCINFNQNLNNWVTTKLVNMVSIFYGCTNFNQPLSNWNTSKVTNMGSVFTNCSKFNQDISSWNVSSVTNMHGMFSGCSSFNQPLNSWNTGKVIYMSSMFSGCSSFNQPLDNWDTSKVTTMSSMFEDCINFNQPLRNWNVSNVTNVDAMFYNCTSWFHSLDTWTFTNLKNKSNAFYNTKLNVKAFWFDSNYYPEFKNELEDLVKTRTDVRLNIIKTMMITDMSYLFQNSTRTNYDFFGIDTWDVSNVTDFSYMFDGCSSFNQNIYGWNTSSAINIDKMFRSATSFNQNIDRWPNSTITSLENAFDNCPTKPYWMITIDKETINKRTLRVDFNQIYSSINRNVDALNVVSDDTTNLTVSKVSNGIFDFTPKVVKMYHPILELNNGRKTMNLNSTTIPLDYSYNTKLATKITIDFDVLYNGGDLTNFSIRSNNTTLVITRKTGRIYEFYPKDIGVLTATTTVEGRNGTITLNVSKLLTNKSYNVTACKYKDIDFKTIYPNADLTGFNLTSTTSNVTIQNLNNYVYRVKSLIGGNFNITETLFTDTSTDVIRSSKLVTNQSYSVTSCITLTKDFKTIYPNADLTGMTITSNNTELSVVNRGNNIFDFKALRSGTYTATLNLNGDTSTITINSNKLIRNLSYSTKAFTKLTIDFKTIYPNADLTGFNLTCSDQNLNITDKGNFVFEIISNKSNTYIVEQNLNGDISSINVSIGNLLTDLFYNNGTNKILTIDFKTIYPNADLTGFKLTNKNSSVSVSEVDTYKYKITINETGRYNLTQSIGDEESNLVVTARLATNSDVEMYQYPVEFIDRLIKPQLYEDNLYIYQYNQYGEIDWISKYFNYINDKMKKYLNFIYLWYVLKTNQDLSKLDMTFINDQNTYYYLNYIESYFDGINKTFGNSSTTVFWDGQENWNEQGVNWDDILNISYLQIDKFKSLLRFIKDINYKSYSLERFIQFCNEFVNAGEDEITNIYVDDTSFEDPNSIILYSDKLNISTTLLNSIIRSGYKKLMPMNDFRIVQK